MKERAFGIVLSFQGEGAGDGVMGVYIPWNFKLTHISVFVTVAGAPTAATIDIQDDGTDIVTAQDISSNGLTPLTTQQDIASGSVIEIDLNLTGGTSPTVTGEIGLFGFIEE